MNQVMKTGRKKGMKMLAVVCMAFVMMLTGCAGGKKLSDKFDEETIKSESMKSIEYFNARDYESIIEMGSAEFKEAITAEQFAGQCDPVLDKCGKFKEITKTVVLGDKDKKTGAEYGGVVMVGTYEDGKIQFAITFDEDMKLVQFYIK